MNVSIKWLKEYVDFDLSPETLAERMLMLGKEIESIKQLGEGLGPGGRWQNHYRRKAPEGRQTGAMQR